MLKRLDLIGYNATLAKMAAFLQESADFGSSTDVDTHKSMTEVLGWVQNLLSEGI
ncbi:Hypothetical protein Cp262_2113 [Corynebacterium pseudotuberculosis]|uniref:hypothetical protein n=1 Tax=Corynebacterium pseudotuberculosis TaxID=1719 RepID=UPI000B61EF6E|nr:hypothetical protein [Corynebacterium pseudotuberculosis]ARX64214.1 Hypothetical protein Cp262_2113 [Corynebacterium pseudotuberculosis]